MRTRLTDLLGIEFPIIQAPMAGVSTPALAAAVSNAGALGSIGVGAAGGAGAKKMMQETKALTDKPWHANFFAHAAPSRNDEKEKRWLEIFSPFFADLNAAQPAQLNEGYLSFLDDGAYFDAIVETRPPVVSFHFGLPDEGQITELKNLGVLLLASATSVEEAIACERAGMDAIIVQGVEAGGHRGVHSGAADQGLGLIALLPQVLDAVSIPVIAAGGVADGRGIAAALALGADGVQMGTAFAACPESSAGARHRAVLGTAAARETLLTSGVSGRPARGLSNSLLSAALDNERFVPDYPVAYDAAKALSKAASSAGREGFEVMWAGQAGALAREMPAADLVELLARETGERFMELNSQLNAGSVF